MPSQCRTRWGRTVSGFSLSTLVYGATPCELLPLVFSLPHAVAMIRSPLAASWWALYLWVAAAPQVLWRHLLLPDHVQSPGSQPGGSGQLCLRLHLPVIPHLTASPSSYLSSSFSSPLPSLATLWLPLRPSGHPHSPVCIPLCLPCLPPTTASNRPCLSADQPGQSPTALHGVLLPSGQQGPLPSCSIWSGL